MEVEKQQLNLNQDDKLNKEDQLYNDFLAGESDCFDELVILYRKPLTLFLMSFVKSYNICEELAQDVFVEILLHKERYKIGQGLKTFLFTIGRNKAVDYIRKNKRNFFVENIEDLANHASVIEDEMLDNYLKNEMSEALHKAIGELNDDYKRAIWLIDFEELTYKETADIFHKTLPQIKILIFRARKALKAKLERNGFKDEIR